MKKSPPNYQKKIPFQKLAKWRRKNIVIKLKKKIDLDRQYYNDNRQFYTHHLFDNKFNLAWCDISIPSKLYNDICYMLFVVTANKQMHEEINNKISTDVYNETEQYDKDSFITKLVYSHNYKRTCHKTIFKDINIPIFNNRTRYEEIQKRYIETLSKINNTYQIYENWILHSPKIEYTYDLIKLEKLPELNDINYKNIFTSHYCVTVSVVLDTDILTVDILNDFINRFYNNNEKSYISSIPISQDHLNYNYNWEKEMNICFANAIDDRNINY